MVTEKGTEKGTRRSLTRRYGERYASMARRTFTATMQVTALQEGTPEGSERYAPRTPERYVFPPLFREADTYLPGPHKIRLSAVGDSGYAGESKIRASAGPFLRHPEITPTASAMANRWQTPSKLLQQPKQLASPETPQDLHPAGSAGIPMANVGCPQGVHTRCASPKCHDNPGPSRRDSRVRHAAVGPLGGLTGPPGGPTGAPKLGRRCVHQVSGPVPQRDSASPGAGPVSGAIAFSQVNRLSRFSAWAFPGGDDA